MSAWILQYAEVGLVAGLLTVLVPVFVLLARSGKADPKMVLLIELMRSFPK